MRLYLFLLVLLVAVCGCQQVTQPEFTVQKIQWGDSHAGDALISDVYEVCGYPIPEEISIPAQSGAQDIDPDIPFKDKYPHPEDI